MATAPSITLQPKGATYYQGEAFSLSVEAANGFPPLLYQWRKGVTPIDNAIAPDFDIASAVAGDQGNYICVVTDQRGTVLTSTAAIVFVVPHLSLVTPVDAVDAYIGDAVSLSVTATGGAPLLTYSWTRDGVPLGLNLATVSTPAAQLSDAGTYLCKVTDGRGESQTSAPIVVDIQPPLSVVQEPQDQHRYTGEPLTLEFIVSGGFQPLEYAWRKGGFPISGATEASFTIPSVDMEDAGNYSCSVRDQFNRLLTSDTVSVQVAEPLDLGISATQIRQYTGPQVSITAAVNNGDGEYHYTWRKNGADLGAPDAAELLLAAPVPASASGTYVCLVTDAFGAGALTPACVVDIREPLSVSAEPEDDTAPALGGRAQFTFGVSGGFEPITFVWLKGLANVPGGGAATLNIAHTVAGDAGTYYCVATDDLDTNISSATAHLDIVPALSVLTQATDAARLHRRSRVAAFRSHGRRRAAQLRLVPRGRPGRRRRNAPIPGHHLGRRR